MPFRLPAAWQLFQKYILNPWVSLSKIIKRAPVAQMAFEDYAQRGLCTPCLVPVVPPYSQTDCLALSVVRWKENGPTKYHLMLGWWGTVIVEAAHASDMLDT